MANYHERKRMINCERFEKVKQNKEEVLKEQIEFKNDVMAVQIARLERGYKIDEAVKQRRLNAK